MANQTLLLDVSDEMKLYDERQNCVGILLSEWDVIHSASIWKKACICETENGIEQI